MAEKLKSLCAKIPESVHSQVRKRQMESGKTLDQYMAWMIPRFYELEEQLKQGGVKNMAEDMKTMAFQVSGKLDARVKRYLAGHGKLTQKAFMTGLIEAAVSQWEAEMGLTDEIVPTALAGK